jgi:lysophospholipase L1-like esterase
MKSFRVLIASACFIGFGYTSLATQAGLKGNSATQPEVNFERDGYDWLHRHADVLDTQKKGNPDVVLIGDSITHYWSGEPKASTVNGRNAWQATFGDLKVLNMGYGWDRTQNVLWRLNHGEFVGITPKTIILNIGTNNLVGDETARTNTPSEVVAGIKAILKILRNRSSKSQIFVMAIFPRGFEKGNKLDRTISELNGFLAPAIRGDTHVHFLDIGLKMRDLDGSISKEVLFDGTHPTEKGYLIWGKALIEAGAIPGKPNL